MRRSLPSLVAGAALAVILVLYMVLFQVRYSEVAVVRTFGSINPEKDVIREPGFYWKLPWPIQKVDTFDARIQTTLTTGEENTTKDGKSVILTTAILWEIDDPYTFKVRCGDMKNATDLIKVRVSNDQKTVIGRYNFSNFVSTDPNELKYDEIEQQIATEVQQVAPEQYGITIKRIAIETFTLPENITENVIEAMKKEREAVAQRYTSEGESTAKQLKDTAEAIAGTIETFANRKAAEILAEGQRRAVEYNQVFRQDEDLAMLLLQIENIPQILSERATLILDQPAIVDIFREQPPAVAGSATQPAGQSLAPVDVVPLVASNP